MLSWVSAVAERYLASQPHRTGHPDAGIGLSHHGQDFFTADDDVRQLMRQQWGVLFQGSALFSAMTVAENVALRLQQTTNLDEATIRDLVAYKLALVGLAGFESYYPAS